MQNQDPTSQTDPNQYINQLVQINSLEQLISINQNLTTVLGAGTPTTNPSGSAGAGVSASDATQSAVAPSRPSVTSVRSITELANQTANASVDSNATRGNLSTPTASPAAASVGHSLDGKVHGPASAHFIRDLPTRALP
jgi:flagellar basal-body rod modification protein FlgD